MTTELENSQINQETKWGGKRPNSGRKQTHGEEEVSRKIKRVFSNHFSDEELSSIIVKVKELALTDKDMMKFCLEQIFGKARQNLGLDGGEDDKPLIITFDEAFKQRYEKK